MALFQVLIGFGMLAVLLAYKVYVPMPDYVQDRGGVTVFHTISSILEMLGGFFELLGLTTVERFRQQSVNAIVPAPKNSSEVHFTQTKFAGFRTIVAWRPNSAEKPADSGGRPGLVHIHGGGWAFGSPDLSVKLISELVERTGITVFAISYRLSIDQPFPSAFDDCLAATRAVFDSAADFNVNPKRIGLSGDSAGGQLAASVAQALSRRSSADSGGDKLRRPKILVLIYPVTQAANLRTDSYLSQLTDPILKPSVMADCISLYLAGSKDASDWLARHGHVTDELRAAYQKATGKALLPSVEKDATAKSKSVIDANLAAKVAASAADYRVSPLLGDGLDKLDLPPAHIVACEFDPLLDDAVLYADRLQRSGVRVQLRRFSTFHGSAAFPNDGREIRDYLVDILKREL